VLFELGKHDATGSYFGLVADHARAGDKIYVIFGAIVPFLLRKVAGGCFELVGEAYMHGIMDGEKFCLC
jgi:hypothetical protein